ncbi:STM4015 family protein [Actinomadura flavalba]|uniref:STM4015 family protein n=1 Tax=Actinomadura flavalba TaxID=1120938 RepID=UPI000363BF7E|nr:STM4015 family protein [Actinomadura flavalba]
MLNWEHLGSYAGLPIAEVGDGAAAERPDRHAWRVAAAVYDEIPLTRAWESFRARVDLARVTTLVLGDWSSPYDAAYVPVVPLLTAAAAELPNLRSLFLGDIVGEEQEISWITHTDITPLFTAFPRLERLDVRGSQGLRLEPFASASLRTLRFEDGGLPAHIVGAVAASDLPNLEHLAFWLGTVNYGGDTTLDDLAPLLAGDRFPSLKHLGLENSELQDEIAAAVASAPGVAWLESLSLALGTLSDDGVEALLSGQPLGHLARLDLHHHFVGEEMERRLRAALPDVDVDLTDRQTRQGDGRFIAVAE